MHSSAMPRRIAYRSSSGIADMLLLGRSTAAPTGDGGAGTASCIAAMLPERSTAPGAVGSESIAAAAQPDRSKGAGAPGCESIVARNHNR
uniref:Uncharacterized protein n=1 Tax=Arundo donax TaxID=35708 RepID=A0A0A8YYU5_ARUDO